MHVIVRERAPSGGPSASNRRRGGPIAFAAIAALLLILGLAFRAGTTGRRWLHRLLPIHAQAAQVRMRPAAFHWSDRFGDGTPDFVRLTDPSDQAAFRRWFTLIAAYQATRPPAEAPAEITDCASLLRYSYREALKRHDEAWFETSGIQVAAPPGEIRAWSYPHSPLGTALFRVKPGAFSSEDLSDGAFAQFADARTLVERNAYFVSRDVRAAQPGDLLFYRQFGQSSPWHSMIVTRNGAAAEVVYDTGPDHSPHGPRPVRGDPDHSPHGPRPVRGDPDHSPHGPRPVRGDPDHGRPGEIRRVLLSELLDHPQPQWRPTPGNPNFLGVYRWNILRGTP
jgi:hypothetical protein